MKSRVLLIGGGSGGHIYPLVAVTQKLREQTASQGREVSVVYYGDPGPYRQYLESQQIPISWVPVSKLRRYASVLNFLDSFKFIFGFFVALVKLFFFMPDVVFSKSGPGTLPILYAARWYRIPVVLHESDSVPGLTNKIVAKHAAVVELAFDFAKQFLPKKVQARVVGNPVREAVINKESAAACRAAFGLNDLRPILFVFGGSLGAQRINYFILEHSEQLLTEFEIIHQVGRDNYEGFKAEYEFMSKNYSPELKANYKLLSYLDDAQMAQAFGAADLVVSRAGSSVFEIAANGKPAVLVPLPEAANNHQKENAYAYQQAGAGIVIEEENLLPAVFVTQTKKILQDQERYEKMRQAAAAFYKPEAATQIAQDILAVAQGAAQPAVSPQLQS